MCFCYHKYFSTVSSIKIIYFRDPQDHHQIMEDTTEDILLRLILEAILLEIEDQHQDLQDQATHLRLVNLNLFIFCACVVFVLILFEY